MMPANLIYRSYYAKTWVLFVGRVYKIVLANYALKTPYYIINLRNL